jgi:hypothetical protein
MPSSPTIVTTDNIALVWGTPNAANLGNNAAGILIDSLTATPKNGEPIDIEGGAGFTKAQVYLDDGFNAKATCVFDSNIVYPVKGQAVTLVGPILDGSNKGTKNYNCRFWSAGWTRARKKEKMIELNFTHRPDCE